jgi:hypothetical protein
MDAVRVPPSLQIDHGPHGSSNQPLDLMRAATLSSAAGFARGARQGGPGQHAVLGCDPSFARAFHEARHAFFNGSSTDHPRVAHFNQRGAFSGGNKFRNNIYRTHLLRSTVV